MKNHIINFSLSFILVFAGLQSFAEETKEELKKPEKKSSAQAEEKKPLEIPPEDQEILDKGEMKKGKYIAGGIVGSAVGLGIGHGIQGRWSEKGWIFTFTEAIGYTMYIGALISCSNKSSTTYRYGESISSKDCSSEIGLIAGGIALIVGFRIWEVIDVWTAPPRQNRKYRQLKKKYKDGGAAPSEEVSLAPVLYNDQIAGLGLRFSF